MAKLPGLDQTCNRATQSLAGFPTPMDHLANWTPHPWGSDSPPPAHPSIDTWQKRLYGTALSAEPVLLLSDDVMKVCRCKSLARCLKDALCRWAWRKVHDEDLRSGIKMAGSRMSIEYFPMKTHEQIVDGPISMP